MESTKGNIVSLQTFQTYETNNVIVYKTINIEGKIMVNFAWCKLCAKHKNAIYNGPNCKANAKKSAEVYIRRRNNITKWSTDRHLGNIKNYLINLNDSNKFE